jgi:hypothetical protein
MLSRCGRDRRLWFLLLKWLGRSAWLRNYGSNNLRIYYRLKCRVAPIVMAEMGVAGLEIAVRMMATTNACHF